MPEFGSDREEVLARAEEAGVRRIINVGCDLKSSKISVRLAESFPSLFAAVGFHPHDAEGLKEGILERLKKLIGHPKVVAIGEIGLDFYRTLSPRQAQLQAFEAQLELATEVELPVVVHSREAEDETFDIVSQWAKRQQRANGDGLGVMHCFAGDTNLAQRYVDLNFFISLGGPVTFASSSRAQAVAREVPLERLLVETDAPYLTPHPHRGRRNEPSYLPAIVSQIAEMRGLDPQVVEAITTENACRLFKLNDIGDSNTKG
jgi:TatD DNase family protein